MPFGPQDKAAVSADWPGGDGSQSGPPTQGMTPIEWRHFNILRRRFLTQGGCQINTVVPNNATAVTIQFVRPEPDLNYGVAATPSWFTSYFVTNKTVTGFKLVFGISPGVPLPVDIVVFRDEGTATLTAVTTSGGGGGAGSNSFVPISGTNGQIVTQYNGIATVGPGLVPVYAKDGLLGPQSAAVGPTTLLTPSAGQAGVYRVSWAATITTAATTSSVLGGAGGFQVTYNDFDTTTTVTPLAIPNASATGNTIGTQLSGTVLVNAQVASPIQYRFGYTSVGGTAMQYVLHVRLEYLG